MQAKKAKKIVSDPGLNIGQRIREIRASRSLTQQALANRAGLTRPAIVQIETSARKPAFETLLALAKSLNISLDALVGFPLSNYPNDIFKDADVLALAERISRLPSALRDEVKNFVDYLWTKRVSKIRRK